MPLADGVSFADFAAALGARLLIVVGARLGAINHALLTIEVARARSLEPIGVVVNHVSPEADLATATLAGSLGELTEVPVLASVPHAADPASFLPP